MRVALLGPPQVELAGTVVRLPAGRLAMALALLAVQANRVVPISGLVEEIWADAPPRSARTRVHELIAALRRLLAEVGIGTEEGGPAIVTSGAGYLLRIAPNELDLIVFRDHLDRAHRAEARGRHTEAAARFRDALALWRGTALEGVHSIGAETEAATLEQERLTAREGHARAALAAGSSPADLLTDLSRLAGEHPLRESVAGLLMTALYRAGRQADALAAFHTIRGRLRAELGIEPGPDLRELHGRMLLADPTLRTEAPRPATEPTVPVKPAQLPAPVPDFTGRAALLARLGHRLRGGTVAVLTGMPGVGTSALAVRAGHQLADEFPDGQLYARLRTADGPRDPAEVLGAFLRELGVPDAAVPTRAEERVARFRSLSAGRRLLVLLDDATDAAQVRPLVPGSGGCAVLVTSARRLADLDGLTLIEVDPLAEAEAIELFGRIVGPARIAAEPEAAHAVLAHCAGLPLALRAAGALLLARPAWGIDTLADRLSHASDPLDELSVGDLSVRAACRRRYAELSAEPARTLRLLALTRDEDLDVPTAAALFGLPLMTAQRLLDQLVEVNLLRAPGPEHYRLPTVLRAFARERLSEQEATSVREAALRRLRNWQLSREPVATAVKTRRAA